MKDDKMQFYLVAIVGIVAAVGILVLLLNAGVVSNEDSGDLTGQAAKSSGGGKPQPRQKLTNDGHKWGEDTGGTGETEDSEEASCYHDCAATCASTYVLSCEYVRGEGCYAACARSSGR